MKDVILPHRAIYLCDGICGATCDGCFIQTPEGNYTTSVIHAKNGPVVNVREWETRFELADFNNLLYYMEKPTNEKDS